METAAVINIIWLSLLFSLGLPVVDPVLTPFLSLMQLPEMGLDKLSLDILVDRLVSLSLQRPQPLFNAPEALRNLGAWKLLWAVLDELLATTFSPEVRAAALAQLSQLALVVTERMRLSPAGLTFRGSGEAKLLFPDVNFFYLFLLFYRMYPSQLDISQAFVIHHPD